MDEPHDSQEAPEPLSGSSVTVPVPELPEDGDDADTAEVLERIKASVLPVPGKNFVRHRLRNNPDLYGPFWICATLALALAISGDLSQLGSARVGSGHRYRPHFHHVPVALTLVFGYAGLVPLALWGGLRWARGGSGGSFSLLETLCAYGYSLAALVPAAVLWAAPLSWLRWAVLALLALPSAVALAVTFWPPLRTGGRGPALAGGAVLVALHTLLALSCQLYFFEPLSTPGSGGAPLGTPPSNASHPT
ncbi:protein YIPF2 isoform X2 [Cinclus cinclus]|uniref:protein YIPF2 isoform X2 n=1 Tax=Cinclus cinclus TaxID=127875 RepID=UPI002E14CD83